MFGKFTVQGQVYHKIGSLLPLPNEEPKFLQIYFMGDSNEQARQRQQNIPNVKLDGVLALQEMLHACNPYVKLFKTALEHMTNNDLKVVIRADKTPAGEHERRFNVPTTNEVAILIVGNEFQPRDIVLHKRTPQGTFPLTRIADTNRAYDPLQYPILFPKGEDGYAFAVIQGHKVTSQQFYAYRLMIREGDFNHLLRCGPLFHQLIVDMYAKIESERLRYFSLNQKKLRVEEYVHLRDAMANEGNANNVGKLTILPSSFTGGPRYMQERTQDAMTYVRNYGTPDLFITFTCNPNWPEILAELLPGQKAEDRADLEARVFQQKLNTLMDLIKNKKAHVFGEVRCYMYSIEWQKRGLPHAHILIWLVDKIRSNQIDSCISAELPDVNADPALFQVVSKHMLHGPCGNLNRNSPCMRDGVCTKRYPRQFVEETQTGGDGYPLYRRRAPEQGGFKVKKGQVEYDNRWVVPYCPLLSRIFNAHINVEYCNSVKAIKYICKYVNKGSDQAVFALQQGGAQVDAKTAASAVKGWLRSDRQPLGAALNEKVKNVETFKDNAGVIKFNDTHSLVFKVETHNSPSALDPYGGALTGQSIVYELSSVLQAVSQYSSGSGSIGSLTDLGLGVDDTGQMSFDASAFSAQSAAAVTQFLGSA
ncbi:MAG: flagellar filament capping protein FliD, partial [Candidatus Micrarchaeaceae archaeon]